MTDKYLVTGVAGFIGSHIAQELLRQGNEVIGIDNLSTGNVRNLEEFTHHTLFHFVKGDVRDSKICHAALRGVRYVLHQAALGSVPRSVDDPWTAHDNNVNGTLTLLEASRLHAVERFVLASSSSVYGGHQGWNGCHELLPPTPRSPYAASKVACEAYCRGYSDVYDIETVSLRYFNVFGPRQNPNGPYAAVVPRFIQAALNKCDEPMTIYGDGTQTRDFTYVSDVVRLNIEAATKLESAYSGAAINAGTGKTTTITGLAHIVQDVCAAGEGCQIKYTKHRAGDVSASRSNTFRLRSVLDFRHEVALRDGLVRTVEWFQSA